MTQRRFPETAYNAVTMIGAALAGACLATMVLVLDLHELKHQAALILFVCDDRVPAVYGVRQLSDLSIA